MGTGIRTASALKILLRVTLGLGALTACDNQPTRAPTSPAPMNHPTSNLVQEEEFLGSVFVNGTRTKDPFYHVTLQPVDFATASRLRHYDATMWADTAGSAWMYGWTDPKAGGKCGSLARFMTGDTTGSPGQNGQRLLESHRPYPGGTPTGLEKHCLRPGTYEFILTHDDGEVARFRVDYLAHVSAAGAGLTAKLVWNQTGQRNEAVEALDYDDTLNVYNDLVVHIDRTPGAYSETRILDVENALANPAKDTFTNSVNPSGSESDFFRFSVARSTSGWSLHNQGTVLARLFWDVGANWDLRTGFWDPWLSTTSIASSIRVRQFGIEITQSRADTVGLELKRPDESPDSTAITKRVIQVDVSGTFACSNLVATVWQVTDQYLGSGCSSRGPNITYRWQVDTGSAWTPYSADTLFDFPGHASTGTHVVTLEVRNNATSQSGFQTRAINVLPGTVALSGPTEIVDKGQKLYTSSMNGQWFERYNPALPWFAATAYYQTSMTRIWPGGNYTVELRQQDSTSNLVKRGRLHIEVCNAPGCGLALLAANPGSGSASSDERWSVFGGGPWISWGTSAARQVDRFYDLLGAHDGATAFTNAAWVTDAGGDIPQRLHWSDMALDVPGTRAFRLTIDNALPTRVFGLALDPDLGSNPADDLSGYDAGRGLVYAVDATRAVGFMLLSSGQNALASVQQYGVGRWAPATPAAAWAAQRQQGIHLLPGPRDVQFVLSAGETTGTVTYTLVMLRATNVRELRRLADEAAAAVGLAR